jgi:DNA-binding MarR family transcriptional regulator
LPRRRMPLLRRTLTVLGGACAIDQSDFAAGYKSALADVVAAYCAAAETDLDRESLTQYVARKPHARATVTLLAVGPMCVSEVSEALKTSLATGSRLLLALRKCGVVEQGALREDKRSRYYQLTLQGHRLAQELEPQP